VKLFSVAYVNPTGTFKGKDIETPISFIPMESIDEIYSEVSKLEDTTIENASGFTKFKEGDLLWAKIPPCMQNGKSAIAKNLTNGLGCGSTEFFVIRPKDERLAIEYLHVILHMKCVRETAMLYFGGSAGQQRVSSAFLENFNFPLPSIDKQQEIAEYVYSIRQKAKQLQEEGITLLESAKKEVERMIIGKI
jgi:type I restriction enzyme S subunit